MPKPKPRRPDKKPQEVGSPLFRQWQLLKLLCSESEGLTAYDLADRFGVNIKTMRRDLILLQRLELDLVATEGTRGLKYWRIRSQFETIRGKRRQYRANGNPLVLLAEQAGTTGNKRKKVKRKVK